MPANRQFVELSDLSPSRSTPTSYPAQYDSDPSEGNHDDLQEHIESDDTFHETDANSQSPIIDNEKRKIRRRKAWQDQHHEVRITKAGKFYRSLMEFSFFTRWLLYILPIGILLAVPIVVGAFKPAAEIGDVRIVWLFLWIEVVWLGLWTAKLFARCLPCKAPGPHFHACES